MVTCKQYVSQVYATLNKGLPKSYIDDMQYVQQRSIVKQCHYLYHITCPSSKTVVKLLLKKSKLLLEKKWKFHAKF